MSDAAPTYMPAARPLSFHHNISSPHRTCCFTRLASGFTVVRVVPIGTLLRIADARRWVARPSMRQSMSATDQHLREPVERSGNKLVVRPGAALRAGEVAGVHQDLQVVGDGRLAESDG